MMLLCNGDLSEGARERRVRVDEGLVLTMLLHRVQEFDNDL